MLPPPPVESGMRAAPFASLEDAMTPKGGVSLSHESLTSSSSSLQQSPPALQALAPQQQQQQYVSYEGGDEVDEDEEEPRQRGRSRRELPAHAVAILKAWLVSPEHFHHPYPTAQDQAQLMEETGIDKKQLKNWFTNARRRIWKPMVKTKLQQGDTSIDPAILDGAGRQPPVARIEPPDKTTRPGSPQHYVQRSDSGSSAPPYYDRQQHRYGPISPPLPRQQQPTPLRQRYPHHHHHQPSQQQKQQQPSQQRFPERSQRHLSRTENDVFLDLLATAVDEPPRKRSAEGLENDDNDDDARVSAVRVSRDTACHFCCRDRVDTQLMPCKHHFHGHCLRPWLEATVTTPCCPVCAVAISNCVSPRVLSPPHRLPRRSSPMPPAPSPPSSN